MLVTPHRCWYVLACIPTHRPQLQFNGWKRANSESVMQLQLHRTIWQFIGRSMVGVGGSYSCCWVYCSAWQLDCRQRQEIAIVNIKTMVAANGPNVYAISRSNWESCSNCRSNSNRNKKIFQNRKKTIRNSWKEKVSWFCLPKKESRRISYTSKTVLLSFKCSYVRCDVETRKLSIITLKWMKHRLESD